MCRYAAEAGFDGIEINGFRPHPHPSDYDTDEKCYELKRNIEDLGLGISAYASDFRKVPPAFVEREEFIEEVDRCLDFCDRMGIRFLRVDTISPPDSLADEVYATQFRTLTDSFRAAADRCREHDVTMVWEFEPGFWLNSPSEIVKTVETVGHPGFRLLFDTSHAYMVAVVGARQTGEREVLEGGVNELADLLLPYIGHWHFIDSDGTLHNNETSTHTPFGEGNIDLESFFSRFADDLSSAEWSTCDFCFCETSEEDGRKSIPFLESVVAKSDS